MAAKVVIDVAAQFTDGVTRGASKAQAAIAKLEQTARRLGHKKVAVALQAVDRASRVVNTVWNTGKRIAGKVWRATVTVLDKATAPIRKVFGLLKSPILQAGAAMTYMGMAGWKTQDMLSGIEGIMNLAAASSNANTNVSLMGETFKYVGTQAGALGYSIEDVVLATGLITNVGLKGSMAGTSLNAIMTRLTTNTSGAADTVRALGVEFFNSDGTARKLCDVMDELRQATAEQNVADSRSMEYDLVKWLLTATILCQRKTKII